MKISISDLEKSLNNSGLKNESTWQLYDPYNKLEVDLSIEWRSGNQYNNFDPSPPDIFLLASVKVNGKLSYDYYSILGRIEVPNAHKYVSYELEEIGVEIFGRFISVVDTFMKESTLKIYKGIKGTGLAINVCVEDFMNRAIPVEMKFIEETEYIPNMYFTGNLYDICTGRK